MRMFESLKRLSALPVDTLVFCAHEYTHDNLKFAHFAYPEKDEITTRLAECEARRTLGEATIPSTIGLERVTNPFIIASSVESFAELRTQKDRGAHRS